MDDILLFLGIGIMVVGLVAGVLRSRERTNPSDVLTLPVDPAVVEAVLGLLGRNRKIQAIKELREATGLGLADAKSLTEAIERGHRPPPVVGQGAQVERRQNPPPTSGPDLAERARALRADGRETEAIRLVCDETGMGILDSQKFVRAL